MAHKQDQINEYKFILPENKDVSLFGALRSGISVRAELHIPSKASPKSVKLRIHSDGYEGEVRRLEYTLERTASPEGEEWFYVELDTEKLAIELVGKTYGLFYYEYAVETAFGTLHLGGEEPKSLTDAYENGERQLLVFKKEADSSKAWRRGIIYHIFVDRFNRSGRCGVKEGAVLDPDWENGIPQYGAYPGADVSNNVFFGGDLYGIIEKLPYIASLGTSVLYLSPVFDAASNHKYDTADYLTVDSMFGGDEALKMLCDEAGKYGIGVMLDGVFNHTGSDSIYFNKEEKYDSVGAYHSKESPYYDWYSFRSYPDEYECWWGVKILPRVNSANEDYSSFICDEVVQKWMDAGVSHWRLDVADELSEVFLQRLEAKVHSISPDAQIVGEVWEDASDKVSYGNRRHYLCTGELSSVMNYPLRSAIISYIKWGDTESLRHATEGLYRRYPKHVSETLMNFLGTHDTERALTIFGDDEFDGLTNDELAVRVLPPEARELAKAKLTEAYAMICALPGIPCVFYGDEVGLEGYRDPFCRKPFPWTKLDEDLLATYKRLGSYRTGEKLLEDSLFEIEALTDEYFAVKRYADSDADYSLLAVFNNTDRELEYKLDGAYETLEGEKAEDSITLAPRGWVYLKKFTVTK